jgi:glycosyltransferase involved in cell wall biosynthesis
MWSLLNNSGEGFGGGETEMWTMMRGLADRGEVCVSLLTAADVPAETVIENIPVAGIPSPRLTDRDSRLVRIAALISYAFGIGRRIQQSRVDVIFMKLPSFEMFAVAVAGWILRKPVVFRVVSNWETDEKNLAEQIFHGSRLKVRLFRFCLRRFNRVLCQTQHQRSELNRNFGVEAVLIPNVHALPDVITSISARQGVLWVGRAHPGKQPQAFLQLADANWDVAHTMIMAPAPEYSALSAEVANAASIQTNLQFQPGLPSGEVLKLYELTRVLALTSEAEGFSNVVIEALKNGVPVVSLFWNPDGLFLPIGESDVSDCAAAPGFVTNGSVGVAALMMKRLNQDDIFWKACSDMATDYVRKTHSPDVVLPQYEALFAGVAR